MVEPRVVEGVHAETRAGNLLSARSLTPFDDPCSRLFHEGMPRELAAQRGGQCRGQYEFGEDIPSSRIFDSDVPSASQGQWRCWRSTCSPEAQFHEHE